MIGKFLNLALLILLVLMTTALAAERRIAISEEMATVVDCEIVLPEKSKLLDYAADELQNLLSQATGKNIAITATPSEGETVSLILGQNKFLVAAGLVLDDLPQEGYYIKRAGNRIFLAGRDSSSQSPNRNWGQRYQRGTLSAVYDFLERFLGVRFYFPGEFGTIVPTITKLQLPQVIDIIESPDLEMRQYYNGNCQWHDTSLYNGATVNNLNIVRLRLEEQNVPFCHGTAYLKLTERFGQTHPEYFALMPDGSRFSAEVQSQKHSEQLCFSSSGLREEIAQDAIDYLSAKTTAERNAAAATRGMKYWPSPVASPGYFCVMPNDWLYMCHCEQCKTAAGFGGRSYPTDPAGQLRSSNHLWDFTADIARRVQVAGVPGKITQMAYTPYKLIPSIDLPDNIIVQVAVKGMTSTADNSEEDALLAGWKEKTGRPVAIWTYPGKHMQKSMLKGIPVMIPNIVGKYIADRRDLIFGTFLESETDYFIYNYLVYYVFAKVSWNTETDIKALLAEHYQLMYAEAAPLFQQMFEAMEHLWLNKILGFTVDTSLGPVTKLPNTVELWAKIYTPELLADFQAKLDQSEQLTANNPAALKRVRYLREKFFGPIFAHAQIHKAEQEAFDSWNVTLPGEVFLRPFTGALCEVNTTVKINQTPDSLVFNFICEEPLLEKMLLQAEIRDSEVYADSCVEVLLNPSADRKTYYQFIVNANGIVYDAKYVVGNQGQKDWNSSVSVKTALDEQYWTAEITVPLSDIGPLAEGGFPANFARNRAIKAAAEESYYQWSPATGRSFHEISQWGTLYTTPPENKNLLQDWNFAGNSYQSGRIGVWWPWRSGTAADGQKIELDERVFISGGQSLHLTNVEGLRLNAVQHCSGFEPSSKYRLSYFFRGRALAGAKRSGSLGAGAYFTLKGQPSLALASPKTQILGDQDWVRIVSEFTTNDSVTPESEGAIGLWIWNAAGEAWFDHLILEKIAGE